MSRPLLCHLGVAHHWRTHGVEPGELVRRCQECGREQVGLDWRWLVTRSTTCKLRGHRWVAVTYPGTEDSRFVRCLRCARRTEKGGPIAPFL